MLGVINQARVPPGHYREAKILTVQARMQSELNLADAPVAKFRFRPHHIDGTAGGCVWGLDYHKLKPVPRLDLMARWPVDLQRRATIEDMDIGVDAAAKASGCGVRFDGGAPDALIKRLTRL